MDGGGSEREGELGVGVGAGGKSGRGVMSEADGIGRGGMARCNVAFRGVVATVLDVDPDAVRDISPTVIPPSSLTSNSHN